MAAPGPSLNTGAAEVDPGQLALSARAGCRDSFSKLVVLFEKRIFNYLLQIVRNPQDAEDLAQESFIKAYRNIERFDPRFCFSTWLFTIAKRTAISHFRSLRNHSPLTEPTEQIDAEHPALLLERKDDHDSLWTLARTLKPQEFEALWLRYAEEFPVAGIARILQTNSIHVKVILHRARSRLLKKLRHANAGAKLP